MTTVTATYRDGRVAQLENIYIRGSKIRSEAIARQKFAHYILKLLSETRAVFLLQILQLLSYITAIVAYSRINGSPRVSAHYVIFTIITRCVVSMRSSF